MEKMQIFNGHNRFRMSRIVAMALPIFFFCTLCQGLMMTKTTQQNPLRLGGNPSLALFLSKGDLNNDDAIMINRRRAVFGMTGMMTTVMMITSAFPHRAEALQNRNEALCGTGFFTNIAQYKCTDVGDISDEGKASGLNMEQSDSMSSLMDKLGMETNSNFVESDDENKDEDTEGQSLGKKDKDSL